MNYYIANVDNFTDIVRSKIIRNSRLVSKSSSSFNWISPSINHRTFRCTRKIVSNKTDVVSRQGDTCYATDAKFYLGEGAIYDRTSRKCILSCTSEGTTSASMPWFILSLNGSFASSELALVNMSADKSYRSREFTSRLWPYRQISMGEAVQ